MTLTYELDTVRVKMSRVILCTHRHTQQTDRITWTIMWSKILQL